MTKDNYYRLNSRAIPRPSGASDQVQKAIIDMPQPDVDQWQENRPSSPDEWQEISDQIDTLDREFIAENFDKNSVTVKQREIAGVNVYDLSPQVIDSAHDNFLFICLHGGGYFSGQGEAGLSEAMLVATNLNVRVLAVDYRMPPQFPFPAALDDVVTVYEAMLEQYPSTAILLGGSSAGGSLVLSAMHKFRELELDIPGALFVGTPWADLTKTGDSYFCNEGLDRALVSYEGPLAAAAKLYAGSVSLDHPLVSPIYGFFDGFPPTFLVSGTRDLFLSNTVRVHTKMRAAGVIADLIVFEGQSHGDYALLIDSVESQLHFNELFAFMRKYLD